MPTSPTLDNDNSLLALCNYIVANYSPSYRMPTNALQDFVSSAGNIKKNLIRKAFVSAHGGKFGLAWPHATDCIVLDYTIFASRFTATSEVTLQPQKTSVSTSSLCDSMSNLSFTTQPNPLSETLISQYPSWAIDAAETFIKRALTRESGVNIMEIVHKGKSSPEKKLFCRYVSMIMNRDSRLKKVQVEGKPGVFAFVSVAPIAINQPHCPDQYRPLLTAPGITMKEPLEQRVKLLFSALDRVMPLVEASIKVAQYISTTEMKLFNGAKNAKRFLTLAPEYCNILGKKNALKQYGINSKTFVPLKSVQTNPNFIDKLVGNGVEKESNNSVVSVDTIPMTTSIKNVTTFQDCIADSDPEGTIIVIANNEPYDEHRCDDGDNSSTSSINSNEIDEEVYDFEATWTTVPEQTVKSNSEADSRGRLSSDDQSNINDDKPLIDFYFSHRNETREIALGSDLLISERSFSGAYRNIECGYLGRICNSAFSDVPKKETEELSNSNDDVMLTAIDAKLHDDDHMYINVNQPFCLVCIGIQGSGKSHTMNVVLENCLLNCPVPVGLPISRLHQAMCGLVLHYDQSPSNTCEAAGLHKLSTRFRMLSHNNSSVNTVQRMVILVSPTYYQQRKKFYEGCGFDVIPLLFSWSSLSAQQLKKLMRLCEYDTQLYVSVMLDALRQYQRADKMPNYNDFVVQIQKLCTVNGQGK